MMPVQLDPWGLARRWVAAVGPLICTGRATSVEMCGIHVGE